MTKVLMVGHDGEPGGAQNVLHALLVGVRDHGVEPIAVFPNEGLAAERCRHAGIPTHIVPLTWWTSLGRPNGFHQIAGFLTGLRKRVERLAELIHQEKVEVAFTNTAVIVEPALAAWLTGRGHVWQVLEMLSRDEELCDPSALPFVANVMRLTRSRLSAVSSSVRNEMLGWLSDYRIDVIPSGIDLNSLHPETDEASPLPAVPQGSRQLLFLGVLTRRKGVDVLMRAMPRVWERCPDMYLLLAGKEVTLSFADLVEDIPADRRHRVQYIGFQEHVGPLLSWAEAVVCQSLLDPLPVSVLEAMAAGRPVIGTRSGGMEDMIVDGETGRLAPPDDPDALAEAILDVLASPERARGMGEAAEARLRERFDIRLMSKAFAALFRQAAAAPKTDAAPQGVLELLKALQKPVHSGIAGKAE